MEIEFKNFSKYYNEKTKIKVCDDISFSISEGEIVSILGPNGAGKSTLLKAICGYHFASEGCISVCGESDLTQVRKISSFLPEKFELNKNLTVYEILYLELSLFYSDKNELKNRMEYLLENCSLKDVVHKKVSTLSRGYFQRLGLAKALCKDPKVLILDEFSSGLDPAQVVHIHSLIKSLKQGRCIIFSTHNIDEALNLCDRVFIINKGKILCSGTCSQIINLSKSKTLEEAYLKLTGEINEKSH